MEIQGPNFQEILQKLLTFSKFLRIKASCPDPIFVENFQGLI